MPRAFCTKCNWIRRSEPVRLCDWFVSKFRVPHFARFQHRWFLFSFLFFSFSFLFFSFLFFSFLFFSFLFFSFLFFSFLFFSFLFFSFLLHFSNAIVYVQERGSRKSEMWSERFWSYACLRTVFSQIPDREGPPNCVKWAFSPSHLLSCRSPKFSEENWVAGIQIATIYGCVVESRVFFCQTFREWGNSLSYFQKYKVIVFTLPAETHKFTLLPQIAIN